MQLRAFLRANEPGHLKACGERLLGELGSTLLGVAVMSEYSVRFYSEEKTTYADVLERALQWAAPVSTV
jgi:hypothetical protein